MKKTIICNITMKDKVSHCVYTSDDNSLLVSNRAVIYPINSLLEKSLNKDDEIDVILLVKKDKYEHYVKNTEFFRQEINTINKNIGAKIKIKTIETDFKENKDTHTSLLGLIIDNLDDNTHIVADVTYGPKDLIVVLFTALNFAEKFLDCSIDNIVYGQALFENGHIVDTKLCDMMSLYYLSSICNTIHNKSKDKARDMLKALLAF